MADSTAYDVALSFASEDRDVARHLATLLSSRGARVFYDENDVASLWGKDLHHHLINIYAHSKFVVLLVSQAYVRKSWTRFEAQAAIARAGASPHAQVLPLALDDSVHDLPWSAGFVDLRRVGLENVADLVLSKLRHTTSQPPRRRSLPLHVFPSEGGWVVKRSATSEYTEHWQSKDAAIDAAREVARQTGGEVVIHRRDGTIESRDTPTDEG
jgi:hypothetical protein